MKIFGFALVITAMASADQQPQEISPKDMKLSEDFFPETARDVVIEPQKTVLPIDNEIQRRSAHSSMYSTEGEALGKILLALRYLYLMRPNSTQHHEEVKPGAEYGGRVSKLFYVIQKTAQNAVEKATKKQRSFSEKRQFCENLRKLAKKLEIDFASKDVFEKIYVVKSKMSRAILEQVDRAADIFLHGTGTSPENAVYKFAAMEKMAEFAVIMLHQHHAPSDLSNNAATREMCASFHEKSVN